MNDTHALEKAVEHYFDELLSDVEPVAVCADDDWCGREHCTTYEHDILLAFESWCV